MSPLANDCGRDLDNAFFFIKPHMQHGIFNSQSGKFATWKLVGHSQYHIYVGTMCSSQI